MQGLCLLFLPKTLPSRMFVMNSSCFSRRPISLTFLSILYQIVIFFLLRCSVFFNLSCAQSISPYYFSPQPHLHCLQFVLLVLSNHSRLTTIRLQIYVYINIFFDLLQGLLVRRVLFMSKVCFANAILFRFTSLVD